MLSLLNFVGLGYFCSLILPFMQCWMIFCRKSEELQKKRMKGNNKTESMLVAFSQSVELLFVWIFFLCWLRLLKEFHFCEWQIQREISRKAPDFWLQHSCFVYSTPVLCFLSVVYFLFLLVFISIVFQTELHFSWSHSRMVFFFFFDLVGWCFWFDQFTVLHIIICNPKTTDWYEIFQCTHNDNRQKENNDACILSRLLVMTSFKVYNKRKWFCC